MVHQMLIIYFILFYLRENSHVSALSSIFKIQDTLELSYVLLTDKFDQAGFIEDNQRIQLLLATR